MKTSIIALLIFAALISCRKDQQPEKKPDTLSAVLTAPKISATKIEGYAFNYAAGAKKMQLICKRVTAGDTSKIVLSDTSGKTVYASITMNDVSGVMSNILTPNTIPFEQILPPGTYPSWASCMADAIKMCARLGALCPCQREWIVGCMFGWAKECVSKYQVPINATNIRLPFINNLGAMQPVIYP